MKESLFKAKISLPFNILKSKGEDIVRQAGIRDWEEEIQHLRNQLSPEQIGSCEGIDMRQKKRDDRKLYEEKRLLDKKRKKRNKIIWLWKCRVVEMRLKV